MSLSIRNSKVNCLTDSFVTAGSFKSTTIICKEICQYFDQVALHVYLVFANDCFEPQLTKSIKNVTTKISFFEMQPTVRDDMQGSQCAENTVWGEKR